VRAVSFEESKFRFFSPFCLFERKRQFFKLSEKRERERDKVRGEKKKATIQMSGVITRAQRRRMGQRDLWDVIVNNDDVCFKHILPRLNGTDIKFLYDVNNETRALIKRSSRMGKLKRRFKVHKMSSISTLEFAWDNVQWGAQNRYGWAMDQAWFCSEVASTNKLELLKWAREEKKCEWEERTIEEASYQGNLEMIKYCVANQCPMDDEACACAAEYGQLECLKYLHEEVKAPWNWLVAAMAAENGHLHILEYLVERKYDKFCAASCWGAAVKGHLDCLKFLHETAKAPWNFGAVLRAHKNNHPECLQYLLDNDCPLPLGWRYEHGTLFTS
jgi:hypothetical protein